MGTGLSWPLAGGCRTSALWSSLAHSEAITLPSSSTEHSVLFDFSGLFPANWFDSLFVHLKCVQPHDAPQLPPADRHLHLLVLHNDFLLHEQQSPPPAVLSVLTLFSLALLISGVSIFILSFISSQRRDRTRSPWLDVRQCKKLTMHLIIF